MSVPLRKLPQPEAMLFDLDGTLFKTETLLLPAYRATFDRLREEGLYEGPTPPESVILGSLGMLLEHIWERVMPDSPKETHRRADELLLDFQLEGLRKGDGELYDGVGETLRELQRRGIRLFVASNGLEPYVKGVVQAKGLSSCFEDLYSAGEHRTRSKVDLVKLLLERHNVRSAWMVGDRSSDVEAGSMNGLVTIGCDYAGFRSGGELDGCDVRISGFAELPGLLE
jgi:phosphoglycolate phosphatase-like HAD superfamily hydrolase